MLRIVSIGIHLKGVGKWFVETIGKIFHMNFLGFSHWFMSTRISHMKDHSIYLYQTMYVTSIVAKYLDTSKVKTSKKFYNTTLAYDMIFTKYDVSTGDEKFDKLVRELNIHYRDCIGLFIYLLSTRERLSFAVSDSIPR